MAASAWHWVDPTVGWQRAHDLLHPGGWIALLGNVVVRQPGEPEVYAETADLHEQASPGNPGWGHPPLEMAQDGAVLVCQAGLAAVVELIDQRQGASAVSSCAGRSALVVMNTGQVRHLFE